MTHKNLNIACHHLHFNRVVNHPIENNHGNVHKANHSIVRDHNQKLPVVAAYACAIIVNQQGKKNVAAPANVDSIYNPLSFPHVLIYFWILLGNQTW